VTNTWVTPTSPSAGLAEVLGTNGRRAVAFYNWEELRDVTRPGSLAASFYPCDPSQLAGDKEVATVAATWLASHEFEFAFVYLGYTDTAGHAYGWMSNEYLRAIAHADGCIDRVMSAIPEGTLVAVTSDHGGHDHAHGTECAEDMTIPLILSGTGVPAGRTIASPVLIIDIAPTITSYLGTESPTDWAGVPVWESLAITHD
jgi:predicted AlkP superfamily pyrophosphatase or phosphodiesterase